MTRDVRGADRGGTEGDRWEMLRKDQTIQAQWVRLLGKSDDIKSKEYNAILLVLIYYWDVHRPCCVAHRPGPDKANDKALT